MTPARSDQEIIDGYLAGENWAVAVLDPWVNLVIGHSIHGSWLDREDASQDTRRRLLRALPKFRSRSSLRTYVCRITTKACSDHHRKEIRRRKLAERLKALGHQDPPRTPLDDVQRSESADLADQMLHRTDPRCRDLLRMRFYEDLSYEIIAGKLGGKTATLRAAVSRCIKKLRAVHAKGSNSGNLNDLKTTMCVEKDTEECLG